MFLIDFFEYSTIRAYIPGAPQGSQGSRGVCRNPANSPRAPQASVGTLRVFAISVSDPGAPQVSLWPLRARRKFVDSPGVAQGPFGPFGIWLLHDFDPRAPQSPRGDPGTGPFWLARGGGSIGINCEHLIVKASVAIGSSFGVLTFELRVDNANTSCYIGNLKHNNSVSRGPRFGDPQGIRCRNAGARIEQHRFQAAFDSRPPVAIAAAHCNNY